MVKKSKKGFRVKSYITGRVHRNNQGKIKTYKSLASAFRAAGIKGANKKGVRKALR